MTPLRVGVNEILQARNYAARKGTREKARKKKVKVEVKKAEFVTHSLRKRTALRITKRINDSMKPDPVDNVWYSGYYKWPVYRFADAVQCHRETHHPTVFNSPDEDLYVHLELDMRVVKVVTFFISVPLI